MHGRTRQSEPLEFGLARVAKRIWRRGRVQRVGAAVRQIRHGASSSQIREIGCPRHHRLHDEKVGTDAGRGDHRYGTGEPNTRDADPVDSCGFTQHRYGVEGVSKMGPEARRHARSLAVAIALAVKPEGREPDRRQAPGESRVQRLQIHLLRAKGVADHPSPSSGRPSRRLRKHANGGPPTDRGDQEPLPEAGRVVPAATERLQQIVVHGHGRLFPSNPPELTRRPGGPATA